MYPQSWSKPRSPDCQLGVIYQLSSKAWNYAVSGTGPLCPCLYFLVCFVPEREISSFPAQHVDYHITQIQLHSTHHISFWPVHDFLHIRTYLTCTSTRPGCRHHHLQSSLLSLSGSFSRQKQKSEKLRKTKQKNKISNYQIVKITKSEMKKKVKKSKERNDTNSRKFS